jgi:hypothetical protein
MERELLPVLGVIRHRPAKDHEATGLFQEGVLLSFGVIPREVGFFFPSPFLEPWTKTSS